MNSEIFEKIADIGVIPVLCPPSADDAEPLAEAFIKGGVPAFEVTLRKPWALEVIRRVHAAFPDMVLGAGTVFTREQVDEAKKAGAKFIVAPGFDQDLYKYCIEQDMPLLAGCVTPTEITAAVKMGMKHIKFFPTEQNGGVPALSLMHGPFPQCSFIPTGGINTSNMAAYLDKPFVAAIGAGFLAEQDVIKEKNWEKITATCRAAMDISLGFELAHVGINHDNADDAIRAAKRFGTLFRMPIIESKSAVFAGKAVENRKSVFHGTNGHIGFTTRSTRRALAWYQNNGIAVKEESIVRSADGNIESFYLDEEIAGFAVHVVKKNQ